MQFRRLRINVDLDAGYLPQQALIRAINPSASELRPLRITGSVNAVLHRTLRSGGNPRPAMHRPSRC